MIENYFMDEESVYNTFCIDDNSMLYVNTDAIYIDDAFDGYYELSLRGVRAA